MKKLLLLAFAAGSTLFATGCATPAYSPTERHQQIARNWNYEGEQAIDDIDHILLLRPASHLTVWNLR